LSHVTPALRNNVRLLSAQSGPGAVSARGGDEHDL